jgi:hypothetical protein
MPTAKHLSVSISLMGALFTLALLPSIHTEKATAQGTSIGVCGLSIPKEYKNFVIAMYTRDSSCPTIANNKSVYNKIIIENIRTELLMCGISPPPGFVVMQYRRVADCTPNGKFSEKSENINAIFIEKGSPQKKGLVGPPTKGSETSIDPPSPKFEDVFSPK